jgi:hypothetical protein
MGFALHVALPAKPLLAIESRSSNIVTLRNHNGGPREGTASVIDEEKRMLFS